MNLELQNKIGKLKKRYITPEDRLTISDTEKGLRRKAVEAKLSDNDAVKMIVEEAEKDMQNINLILASDENLEEAQRKLLFQKKKVIKYYILDRLSGDRAKQYMATVEKGIDDRLKN